MLIRFPCVVFAVIALVAVTTLAGISVHVSSELGSLVPASPMLQARSGHCDLVTGWQGAHCWRHAPEPGILQVR
jgi:hypothetical protein